MSPLATHDKNVISFKINVVTQLKLITSLKFASIKERLYTQTK